MTITIHRPFVSQFLQLLLAGEATVARIPICRPVFVYHLDVIFRCDMKKHCFIPHFRYSVAALPITSITPQHQKSKSNLSLKARLAGWNACGCDWTSAPHISLRSGMFKHHNVVPITAAKLDSEQQSKQETIPPIRTGAVTRNAIRQMLAAAHSQETHLLEEKPQRAAWNARRRGKIVYMSKRSPGDSCNT